MDSNEKFQKYKIPYFPSGEEYDLTDPSGQARYLAHVDLDPIGGLIDYSDKAEGFYSQYLLDTAKKSNDIGDFITYSKCVDRASILSARIAPLGNYAILLMMMSVVEEAFNTWCRLVEAHKRLQGIEIKQLTEYIPKKKKDHGLDKAIDYLKEYAAIDYIKQDKSWGYIDAIRTARNMIVHNGGRVKESEREKMEHYNIGMREEDYGLYIDHETIENMYTELVGFVDRVMGKKGS